MFFDIIGLSAFIYVICFTLLIFVLQVTMEAESQREVRVVIFCDFALLLVLIGLIVSYWNYWSLVGVLTQLIYQTAWTLVLH